MPRLIRTPWLGLALSACLSPEASAQLSAQVRAVSELKVTSWNGVQSAQQALPPGSDLTHGFQLSAISGPTAQNPFTSAGNSMATAQWTQDTYVFELSESASGAFGSFQSAGAGSFGPHEFEFLFSHPTARAMELVIERCLSPSPPNVSYSVSGSATLPGGQTLPGTPAQNLFDCLFNAYREVDVIPITLDQTETRVVLRTDGSAIGSIRGGASVSARWRLTVRPDTTRPCATQSYGQGCGPQLQIVEDPLLGPTSYRATLDDPALPSAAWLVAGGQRTQTPLLPACNLLNDGLVIVPWPIDAQGHAELVLASAPGQTFALQLQAATWANGLRLSNGFEFACR